MFRVVLAVSLFAAPQAFAMQCTPLDADIVSLGEKAARFYAERSIKAKIEDEKQRITGLGGKIGKVVAPQFDCKYFPNVVAMDEWRCTASAKVCMK